MTHGGVLGEAWVAFVPLIGLKSVRMKAESLNSRRLAFWILYGLQGGPSWAFQYWLILDDRLGAASRKRRASWMDWGAKVTAF
jgi:hypothetical protein